MKRWLVALAWMLSPVLVQPAAAHAREQTGGLCGENTQTVLFSAVAPTHSSMRNQQVAPLAAADASDDGQTAWCVSPDDPRCSPRDAGSPLQAQRSLPQLCAFASVRADEPLSTEIDQVALRARLGAPRAGVSVRLERPPRA